MNRPWDLPAQQDDVLTEQTIGRESSIIQVVGDKAARHLHEMPEDWLRSRVRGWMEQESRAVDEETGNIVSMAWWVGTYTAEGKWISASSGNDTYKPKIFRQAYAMEVCKHINKVCNFGGAWVAGWFRGGREMYTLWKDADGDIQIAGEANKPFIALVKWTVEDWERLCCTSYARFLEQQKLNEIRAKDTVKLAQGERTSDNHLRNAPT